MNQLNNGHFEIRFKQNNFFLNFCYKKNCNESVNERPFNVLMNFY